jgi:hypothetical protein
MKIYISETPWNKKNRKKEKILVIDLLVKLESYETV